MDVARQVLGARYLGHRGFQAQIKILAHDGTLIDVLFLIAFGPTEGNVCQMAMVDVSDRVRAQDMLVRLQADLAHAARVSMLGELTASIAHEVSQPLTAIETNTEASLLWLSQSPPNLDEVRVLAERTALQAQRAADIIFRIRSMASRSTPDFSSVPINALVEEAILFLRHEIQRHDVSVTVAYDRTLETVSGDRVQLQQVIVNLAVNAIQAMADQAEKQLSITTRRGADGLVHIEVADTGPGIPDDVLKRLFDSFFTTKKSGMGIGLAICRSIVEAHNGGISVDNRTDSTGARVVVKLPEVQRN